MPVGQKLEVAIRQAEVEVPVTFRLAQVHLQVSGCRRRALSAALGRSAGGCPPYCADEIEASRELMDRRSRSDWSWSGRPRLTDSGGHAVDSPNPLSEARGRGCVAELIWWDPVASVRSSSARGSSSRQSGAVSLRAPVSSTVMRTKSRRSLCLGRSLSLSHAADKEHLDAATEGILTAGSSDGWPPSSPPAWAPSRRGSLETESSDGASPRS